MSPPGASGPAGGAASAAALAAGLLVAQQVAGKAVRDGLFLQAFEAHSLPWALVGSAVLSLAAVFAISGLVARRGPAQALRRLVAVSVPLLCAEWLLVQQAPAAGAIAVYAHAALFGATVVSVFFSLVSESFDPWAARAAMARIGLGASLGGVGGGALALLVSRVLPPADLLLGVAALQAASLWAAAALRGGAAPSATDAAAEAVAGVRLLKRSRYLRDLALFVATGAAIQALLDVPLSTAARERYAGADLVTFFSAFHGASALLALVAQRWLAHASLDAFGLAGTLAWRHAVVAAAAGLGTALPGLAAAAVARGGEALLSNSLFRSAYELLFTPLPENRKRPTKALVDVGCDKLGTAAGGSLALVVLLLPAPLDQRALFALAALGAGFALVLCRRLHAGYVEELASSLEQGLVALADDDVRDSTTRYTLARATTTLHREELLRELGALPRASAPRPAPVHPDERLLADVAALRSGHAAAARAVLVREEPPLAAALVPLVIPLLERNELYLEALRALRRAAPAHAGALLDALLDPATPEAVRRRLPRALRGVDVPRVVPGLLMALVSAPSEVRHECSAALLRLVPEGFELPLRADDLHGLAARELLHLRPGRALKEPHKLEHVFHLLSLVHDRRALRAALWALRDGGALRGTALEYLDNVLPDPVADPLFAALGTDRSRTERKEAAALAEQLSRAAPAGEPED
ncbi:MAG: hypothetical protein KJ067_12315 [Vicinamibacteria bacterium]|nr:hypothetical protein [Vicinamibacteria bacterium]